MDRTETVLKCAEYCIEYKWSVRKIAENMCLSKSAVHKYLTEDLKYIDDEKWVQCLDILKHRRVK